MFNPPLSACPVALFPFEGNFAVYPLGADCKNCPLNNPEIGEGPVLAKRNPGAKLIIVGQEPGPDEVLEGEPFVGRSGRLLDRSLEEFDVRREIDTFVTNARLCLPRRKLSAEEEIASYVACRKRLHLELEECDSRTILALGAGALRSLTGHAKDIFAWFGGPQYGDSLNDTKNAPEAEKLSFYKWLVVPTLHPAFCLRSPAYTPVMQTHIQRAWLLATGALKEWKWPTFYLEPNKEAVNALKRILESDESVAVDVETDGVEPLTDTLRVVGVSNGEDTVSMPWNAYFSKRAGQVKGLWDYPLGETVYKLLKEIIETKQLVFQNGQHDMLSIMSQTDIKIRDDQYHFDTLLAHAVVAPRLSHYLDHIATVEFHMPMWKTIFGNTTDQKGGAKFFNRPELETRDYNAKDAYMTKLLVKPLDERVFETFHGISQLSMLMQKMLVAMRMKLRGIKVDPSRFGSHRVHFMRRARDSNALITQANDGVKLNPNSAPQMHELFFNKLQVAPTKYSEETNAPSLDEEVLSNLLHHQNDRVKLAARGLLYFRRWDKLRGTYIDGLPYDSNHVVHTEWKVYGARTGRWSSSPNLQNIPKPRFKTTQGRHCPKKCIFERGHKGPHKVIEIPGLRDIFVARKGCLFVEADYKALELRIATLFSGDELFLDCFAKNIDPHTDTAARIFGKDPKDVSKDERFMAKTANYSLIYGGSAIELWKKVIIDFPNVALWTIEKLHEGWFDLHRTIYLYQQDKIKKARQLGYVECPFSGRRQHYLDGNIDVNEVLNFDIQGTGADLIDPAVLTLDRLVDWKETSILIQAHDALICEATKKRVPWMIERLKQEMTTTRSYQGRDMTFDVDVKVGPDWANMKEVS